MAGGRGYNFSSIVTGISKVNYERDLRIESKIPSQRRRKINLKGYRASHAKN
jgi:hypothetical protein